MPVDVQPEGPDDAAAVAVVVADAFADEPGVAEMVAAIRTSDRYRPGYALVARDGDDVVGFVMLSGVDLVDAAADGDVTREVLSLTPLAVAPSRQRQGIGTALVREALAAAARDGEPLVVLEGDPRYYGPRGFVAAADHGIVLRLPDWAPPEAAQVALLPRHDAAYRGRVVYPPAIAAISEA